MPKMYMPVVDDRLELPLAPPMYSRGAVNNWRIDQGITRGMKVVEVVL